MPGEVSILTPDGRIQPLVSILDRDGSPHWVPAESEPWWEEDWVRDRELAFEIAKAMIQAFPTTGPR